jgi:hypothetical protein
MVDAGGFSGSRFAVIANRDLATGDAVAAVGQASCPRPDQLEW